MPTEREDPPRPRIGPQYQAEIPDLIDKSQLARGVRENRYAVGGLLIPIGKVQHRIGTEYHAELPDLIEQLELARDDRENNYAAGGLSPPVKVVPGIVESKEWTKDEREALVVGLYIFGKLFDTLIRFIGTKTLGDLSRFYYGNRFYKSTEYRLWTKRCKSVEKSQRLYGNALFAGASGDNILSRLLSRVGNDPFRRKLLIKSSSKFKAGKLSLEQYVFEIKGMVGLPALVEAVGIGKLREPVKRADKISPSVRYASLSPTELTDILNRHSKVLNKVQARGLFEKVVWPNLQSRGWQYERLENHKELGLKNPMVFVVDGKENFSTELEMGKDFFNSVKSVLDEVASKPYLLDEQASRRSEETPSSQSSEREDGETQVHSSAGTVQSLDLNVAYVPRDSESDESDSGRRNKRQKKANKESESWSFYYCRSNKM